ncbi:hypothetical protein BPAE_0222g00060 [Botrytis paeoniae]|uniref:RING-type domain-containing protein n=1 Tax=Botrytis paeoniae TaxID=278948 RepID=A0A4Z1FFD5_9HELO|nr:hypothetical protein BPAE_0222g00060 [Botrytis paeoniae]
MTNIERLSEALQRLARDINISSRATTAPGARRSSIATANETKWIREFRIVREVVYARTQTLLRKELSAIQRDLSASEEREPLSSQAETPEPDAATDTGQDTHFKSLEWYFRKAFVDASLRPTQKPLEEIGPCFCSDPYAIETANGECHEAVKMPRCSHIFGRSCIAMWLQEKDTCPMCRQKIVIIPLE